ncbi:hypothetical protein TL16_g07601 [Triparma laevis f. inornata]|uniref:RRM domain-containing protein n=1 Tax=Triparma laevis f. inornata TaxID=1714386 RepID=A0A9W7EGK0_9STRA|nr:hypothetical protein TL16_g07601 [Triparma laevis f. inornata]
MSNRIGSGGPSFERREDETRSGPQRSAEGWVIFVSNIHPLSHEDDLEDLFLPSGHISKIIADRSRQTGHLLGYALIEFEEKEDAEKAMEIDGDEFLGEVLKVSWAFKKE